MGRSRKLVVLNIVVVVCAVAVLAAISVMVPRPEGHTERTDPAALSFETRTLVPNQEPDPQDVARARAGIEQVPASPEVPADSGTGRRVVLSQSDQRVWLVNSDGSVVKTYLVSGGKYDNLHPGTYKVGAHFRHVTGYDYTSKMQYFVQFARGHNAAIGFHDIPVDNAGKPLQTKAQLGTQLSSGCIRQTRPDAISLWKFAPVGTTVVVIG